MSQVGVVTRLAIRELWISFRLLALLAAHVGVGAVVALLPAPPATTLTRLAVGLGAAMVVGCAIAADALSSERALGRASWLVTRSISRATLIVGWFVALSGVALVGLVAAAILGWLTVTRPVPPAEPAAFLAVMVGIGAMCLAGVAVGLLVGSLLRPFLAAVAALVIGIALVAVATAMAPSWAVPLAALRDLPALERPIGAGLQGAGIFLSVTAAALVAARVALVRVDL